jgi:transcriptional regulator with GAF, ATPase, and Fis domain
MKSMPRRLKNGLKRYDLRPGFISPDIRPIEDLSKARPLEEVALRHVYRVLRAADWNKTHAAQILGINVRTIRNYANRMRSVGVDVPEGRCFISPRGEENEDGCL